MSIPIQSFDTWHRALLVFLIVLVWPCWSFGYNSKIGSCLNKLDSEELFERYKFSVFKVFSIRQGFEEIPIGTATLIDNRGYFLTASHIFEGLKDLQLLRLKYERTGSSFDVLNIAHAHRVSNTELDLSLIQVKLPAKDSRFRLAVELAVENPRLGQSIVMMGYLEDEEKLTFHGTYSISDITSPNRTFLVIGGAFYGESGSLAINDVGQAVGVLHRRDEDEPSRIFFTHISNSRSKRLLLEHIPTTSHVKDLASRIEDPKIDKYYWDTYPKKKLRNLELMQLIKLLEEEPHKYKGLRDRELRRYIWDFLLCKDLRGLEFELREKRFWIEYVLSGVSTPAPQ